LVALPPTPTQRRKKRRGRREKEKGVESIAVGAPFGTTGAGEDAG
jgi:hypothetical protein